HPEMKATMNGRLKTSGKHRFFEKDGKPNRRAHFVPAFCLVVLSALAAAGVHRLSANGAADNDRGLVRLAGLQSKVSVRPDKRGIPYIEASNDADLYFAQCYIPAGDRLWQMDLLRRTARGELCEIFGRLALEPDKRHRVYGFSAVSEKLA